MDENPPFREQLKSLVPKINDRIAEHLSRYIDASSEKYGQVAGEYMESLRDVALAGGKRLRGALTYHGYGLMQGDDTDVIFDIAVAIELLHTYLLIEDDFMDRANMRHDFPTLHGLFLRQYGPQVGGGDGAHIANSLAVTASLILAHIAMEIFHQADFPAVRMQKASLILHKQMQIVGHGQMFDIINMFTENIAESDILHMLEWKTASYTVENPLLVGAILGGADEEVLRILSEFAIPLGTAFQIQDDIIGSFGIIKKTGKPATSDILEGKKTLLTSYVEKHGDNEQRNLLHTVLGNPDASAQDIDKLKKVMIDTGALEYATTQAHDLTDTAKQTLIANKSLFQNEESYRFILGMADYLLRREF